MYDKYGLFIDGEWRAASDASTATVASPVTERSLGEAPTATLADAQAALAAAEVGLAAWRAKSAFERADALHAVADEMTRRQEEAARLITLETGKPIAQAAIANVASAQQANSPRPRCTRKVRAKS